MQNNKSTDKFHLQTCLSALGVFSSLVLGSPALAAIATFDSFSEGFSGTTITDGGITFFDLNVDLASSQNAQLFYVDSTTEDYLGSSFSAPNYLTAGGFASGTDVSFGSFSSARITTGKVEQAASLELFTQLFSPTSNILILEALLDGQLMASTSAELADFEAVGNADLFSKTLAISGVAFDELRLRSAGSDDEGVAFIGIDNVRIDDGSTSIPEPTTTFSVLVFGALSAGSQLRRFHRLGK